MKIATLVLNRNLPEVTDQLCEQMIAVEGNAADLFVIEAGSDPKRLSRFCTWRADWPEAIEDGLRICRGFNYGLLQLYQGGRFADYDAFFLLTNDTEFSGQPILAPLAEQLRLHPRLGLVAPCSRRWGERLLLGEKSTRYFWYVQNTAALLRREFIESVMETEAPTHLNFLYDGTNFRGFHAETELVAKGYANNWASGITTCAWAEENESHLLKRADLIKTDSYETNLKLYVTEGLAWMKRKYGFNSRWQMQMYAKFWYEKFFEYHPEFAAFKI
jgi:hypothetical protein